MCYLHSKYASLPCLNEISHSCNNCDVNWTKYIYSIELNVLYKNFLYLNKFTNTGMSH